MKAMQHNLDVQYRPNPKVNNREDERNTQEGFDFIVSILKHCGAQGRWLARPLSKVTLRDRRFKARNLNTEERSIGVTVRPGDSGSAWEYFLSAPRDQHSSLIKAVFAKMAVMLIDNSLRITFPVQMNGEPVAAEAVGPKVVVRPPVPAPPAPEPEPDPILNDEAPASAADARNFLSRLMVINARIEKRETHLAELHRQKSGLEDQILDLTGQLEDVDKAIAYINQEVAEDEEAAGVAQAIKLLKGVAS